MSFVLSFIACVCLPGAGAHASLLAQEAQPARSARIVRTPEGARGIEFYERGDFAEAVKLLKQATNNRRDDATSWHFLALAYRQLDKEKEARKAIENAIFLRLLQLAPTAFGMKHKPWDELSKEEREARRREMAGYYKEAIASVEVYLQLKPKAEAFWRQQYEGLSVYVRHNEQSDAGKESFQSNDEGLSRAEVFYKSPPEYTERARRNGINGTVILRGLLSSDGTVKHIIALTMLPDGLTEKAIEAMRQIKFTPATKNGRPVSQWMSIEYHFNVY
ncbi:MAG TPA: TonB family protein [Pyrinomonadaceae bacterium]|nr:TonB family protein [Pyrinomonadaceae bacterium]